MSWVWQELGHFKALRAVVRCKLHKDQKSLENVLAADERCQALIDTLITA